jgi:hypothetical protein
VNLSRAQIEKPPRRYKTPFGGLISAISNSPFLSIVSLPTNRILVVDFLKSADY